MDVVHVEGEDTDVAQKKRKTDFISPTNKGGSSYTVTVPNDFMSLDRSIWLEAEIILFPCAESRLLERTLPGLMSDGLELIFQVC